MPYFRRAKRDDVPRITEIVAWAATHTTANFSWIPESEEHWKTLWESTQTRYPWIVGTHEERVIAFAKASPHHTREAYAWTAETTIYIDPDFHGRGIGSALYARLIGVLRDQNFETLLAGITDPHPPSEALHRKFGFVKGPTFPHVGWKFGKWHDVTYWSLHLGDPDSASTGPRPLLTVDEVWKAF